MRLPAIPLFGSCRSFAAHDFKCIVYATRFHLIGEKTHPARGDPTPIAFSVISEDPTFNEGL
jgi:hypothetical protein